MTPPLVSMMPDAAACGRAVIGLVAVVGGLGALMLMAIRVRGRAPAAHDSTLRRHAVLGIDPRRRLHLVEAQGHLVLVLCGGTGDALLALPAERAADRPDRLPVSFAVKPPIGLAMRDTLPASGEAPP